MTEDTVPFEIRVACYCGYRGEQEPRRIWFGERCVEIAEITDRWFGPDHRYFKLRGTDRATYIVRHDESTGRWELTLYEVSSSSGAELNR